jgi:hypothetical protein
MVIIGQLRMMNSISFVFFYIWIHTRSCWIASSAMFGILCLSFPPTIYLSKLLFGNAMSLMNVVSLWLVTGNGADDVFVFVDTWNQVYHTISSTHSLCIMCY